MLPSCWGVLKNAMGSQNAPVHVIAEILFASMHAHVIPVNFIFLTMSLPVHVILETCEGLCFRTITCFTKDICQLHDLTLVNDSDRVYDLQLITL